MRVGIIQSNYLPWRGYFDFIKQVDQFIVYDNIQYTNGDWRNRNLIKSPDGLVWITVPIQRKFGQLIEDTMINYSQRWVERNLNLLNTHYKKAPFYLKYIEKVNKILNSNFKTISELNVAFINWVCQELDISTPILMSSQFNSTGTKTERLIDILKKAGATSYLSGPAAKSYLDMSLFRTNGISLEYKTYDYPEYPQLHGPFVGNVSILDLLFNCGPDSVNYITSLTPNEVVLP